MPKLLEVTDLTVDFPTEDGDVHAVRGVSFDLKPGEVLGIVGESGCGKSVTSMAVLGILPKTARIGGSVKFNGVELVGMKRKELQQYRGSRIAMIFQDPMTSFNPVYKLGWQISEALLAHNDMTKKQAWERSVELLEMVGIPQARERADCYPHEFSGGMRQRAMIAMSISNDPDIIIADEPTTALDVTVQAQILELLVKIKDETNSAIMLITHDLGVVAGMSDRMLVMYAGRVVEQGSVEDVFYHPRHPYGVGLQGSIPSIGKPGERLTPIKGSPPSLVNLPPGCPFSPRCPLAQPDCLGDEPALLETDQVHHEAACFHWELVGQVADPHELFAGGAS
jgi:peptide/nickel transport system ATP-binding protein